MTTPKSHTNVTDSHDHATHTKGKKTMTTAHHDATTTTTTTDPTAPAVPAQAPAPPLPASIAAPAAITPEVVQRVIQSLDVIPRVLGDVQPLSIAERKQTLRMKKGGEKLVLEVLGYADQHGLVIPGVSSVQANADLTRASALRPLAARLGVLVALVADAILQSEAHAWDAATMAYTMLLRMVPRYPSLQTELEPMAVLMARQYKSAPTSLRKKEAKQRARQRKAKANAGAATQGTTTAPAQTPPAAAAPAPEAAPAQPAAPAPGNGASHG